MSVSTCPVRGGPWPAWGKLGMGADGSVGEPPPRPTSGAPGAVEAEQPPPPEAPPPPGPPAPPPPSPGRGSTWTAGRVIALVLGVVLGLTGVGVLATGGVALWADRVARDDSGYLSSTTGLHTSAYAVASESVVVHGEENWALSEWLFGDVRVRATSTGSAPVFVGIAATSDVRDYLAGVGHATVADFRGGAASYRMHPGGAPAQAPGDSDIWVAEATGSGTATVSWPMTDGDWTVVVMNADGSRDVDVQAEMGASMPFLDWLPEVLLVTGAVLFLLGMVLVVVGVLPRRARAPAPPATGPPA